MTINLENWNFDTTSTIFICVSFPLFFYFSYWLFITGIIGATRMLQSKNWMSTIGKITDLQIRFMSVARSDEDPAGFKFVVKKTYSYRVNEINYESNKTIASDPFHQNGLKSMSEFPEKYGDYRTNSNYVETEQNIKSTIGNPVTVYYDSGNPKLACLENRFEKQILLPIFMGLFFAAGMTFLVYHLLNPLIE